MPRNATVTSGGRLYWSPKQVRVWTNDGKFLDLGERSLSSARIVAEEFGFELIVRGVDVRSHAPSGPRTRSQET